MKRATHTLLESQPLEFPPGFKEERGKGGAAGADASTAQADSFDARFDRCRNSLELLARRVLSGEREAAEAVRRCRAAASLHPRHFESEGAFRSWLFRLLIEEALNLRPGREPDGASRDIVA
jgi:DNA-directed RNA polymerase specialized sigma24 family protein